MNYKNDYELVYMIRERDEDALYYIFNKYNPLIKSIARKYKNTFSKLNLDLEDLEQEGKIAIYRALDSYNEDNALFSTFISLCIKRAIGSYIRKELSNKNLKSYIDIENLDDLDYMIRDEKINNFEDIVYEDDFMKKIIMFKNEQNILDAQIFELRLNNFKYQEIADLLDIKYKKVDNSMLKIKKNLKKFLLIDE